MLVLGLETSCDETAAAVIDDDYNIHANVVFSQDDHARYGGVVPELASRAHIQLLPQVICESLADAGIAFHDLDGIAVTRGPGLAGSLLVGLCLAKGLALALDTTLIGVHHLEGHIFSNLLENTIEPPFTTLLVSGGHTELIYVPSLGAYELIGRTRDDAAGEAFDKVAKLLNLLPDHGPLNGGKLVADLAASGDPSAISFPRGLMGNSVLDFSFSGLKTAVRNYVRMVASSGQDLNVADVAASFQEAVIEVLVTKTLQAMQKVGTGQVCLAGGVAANRALRGQLEAAVVAAGGCFFCPSQPLCTDNAAMIAAAGVFRLLCGDTAALDLDVAPRLPLATVHV